MKNTDLYAGSWELIPELCLYEFGSAPAIGSYRIDLDEARAQITIEWRMSADTAVQSTGFGGPIDGSPQPLAATAPAAGPDSFSLTRVDERTLDSAAFRSGEQVASARRVASADGSLLAVVQQALDPDGTSYRNFQVYRRVTRVPTEG
jgi:hypothetical protein